MTLRRNPQMLVVLLLATGILLTFANSVLVGWFSIWFQLFGDQPDTDDYEMAIGGFGAGLGLMVLGAIAVETMSAPRWLLVLAGSGAALLLVLLVGTASEMPSAEPGSGYSTWTDGAGGVVLWPWAWPLYWFAAVGVVRRAREARARP